MDDSFGDTDTKVLVMDRLKSLRELAELPAARLPDPEPVAEEAEDDNLPPPEKITRLPRPGDRYKAYSRPDNKALTKLRLVRADTTVRGFAYGNGDTCDLVDSDEPGGNQVIVMRFFGLTPVEIRIEGRNLDQLYDYLGYDRISWIRELPPRRDYKGAGEAVVTRIAIEPLQA